MFDSFYMDIWDGEWAQPFSSHARQPKCQPSFRETIEADRWATTSCCHKIGRPFVPPRHIVIEKGKTNQQSNNCKKVAKWL